MKKSYQLLLLTLIIALVLSACGGGEDKATATSTPESAPEQPTATSTPEPASAQPTATPPPEPSPAQPTEAPGDSGASTGGEAGGTLGDLLDLSLVKPNLKDLGSVALQSYRVRAEWVVEAKQGSTANSTTMRVSAAHVREPLSEEIEFYNEEGGLPTHIIHIGDQLWFQSGDRWIQMSGDEMSVDEVLFAFESATPGMTGDAQLVDQGDLNGVVTRHYIFNESILGLGLGNYNSVQGEVWVAVDGDYVVKYLFSAEDDEATYRWSWEIYDVNAPITIEPPTDVEGARDDIPLMADATERTTVGNLTTYQSASDLTTVTDFYKSEMLALGWTYDEASSMAMDQFAMLNFTKEDATANISLSVDEESGGTTVVIQVTEGE